MPLISVIIAARNAEDTIAPALASLLLQSESDFEIRVVDNGSTDKTVSVIEEMRQKDSRIKLQHCTTPGPFVCRNQAMKDMDCEYMAVMDADDLCLPIRFEMQLAAMKNDPSLSAVGSTIIHFGDKTDKPAMALGKDECRNMVSLFNPCCHPTLLVRRTALEKMGPYDLSYAIGGDYDFVRRLTYCGNVFNIATPLLLYRVHDKQITAQRKKEQNQTSYRVIRDHIGHLKNKDTVSNAEILAHMAMASTQARWALKKQALRSIKAVLMAMKDA